MDFVCETSKWLITNPMDLSFVINQQFVYGLILILFTSDLYTLVWWAFNMYVISWYAWHRQDPEPDRLYFHIYPFFEIFKAIILALLVIVYFFPHLYKRPLFNNRIIRIWNNRVVFYWDAVLRFPSVSIIFVGVIILTGGASWGCGEIPTENAGLIGGITLAIGIILLITSLLMSWYANFDRFNRRLDVLYMIPAILLLSTPAVNDFTFMGGQTTLFGLYLLISIVILWVTFYFYAMGIFKYIHNNYSNINKEEEEEEEEEKTKNYSGDNDLIYSDVDNDYFSNKSTEKIYKKMKNNNIDTDYYQEQQCEEYEEKIIYNTIFDDNATKLSRFKSKKDILYFTLWGGLIHFTVMLAMWLTYIFIDISIHVVTSASTVITIFWVIIIIIIAIKFKL